MKKYAIGLYEKAMPPALSWREKLAFAKEAGYDFVEISIDEKDEKLARLDWTADERLELVRTMKEVGLPIRSMCLSGHRKYPLGAPDPAVRARSSSCTRAKAAGISSKSDHPDSMRTASLWPNLRPAGLRNRRTCPSRTMSRALRLG